jgi:fatty-acyl-CoA synthase
MQNNIGDLLRIAAARHPGREFVVFEGRGFTFSEFNARVNRLAGGLADRGVGRDAVVASMGHNSDSLLALYFAVAKLGAISVPLNTMLTASDVTDILVRSGAGVFAYDAAFSPVADAVGLVEPMRLIVDGPAVGPSLAELEDVGTTTEPPQAAGGSAPSTVIYTSGSTGRPKGCTKSHSNQIFSAINCQLETPRRRGDTELFTVPLAGVGFANFVLPNVIEGSRVVLTRFDPEHCLRLVESERITHVFFAGTMLAAMLEYPGQERYDLSSLQLVETAYQLSDSLRGSVAERFGPIVRYCYGSSEGSNWAAPAELFLSEPDCVGFPKGLDDYRVIDDSGNELAPGSVGEVAITGPTVMLGYFGDPEASARVLQGGWLRSGDLGLSDEHGMLRFRGRLKDIIKSGGLNVPAGEVEMAIARHARVREVAVIGVSHDKWGEAVRAVVVARGGVDDELRSELVAHCREQLAAFKRPKDIVFADELPKNPGGKIAKGEVRERFGDAL